MHQAGWERAALEHEADAYVIVDVLSFSTCVDIALARGASVIPFLWKDERAEEAARHHGAILAGKRSREKPSLSPASLELLNPGDRLLLPSPNGSTLSLARPGKPVYCGCLRNADAIARAAQAHGSVSVVAAGERWPDNIMRPALEDMIGAGAILDALDGPLSAPAQRMRDAFLLVKFQLEQALFCTGSGQELVERGFPDDIKKAAELNVSSAAPYLENGLYINSASR